MTLNYEDLAAEFNLDNGFVADTIDQAVLDIENAIDGNNIANPDQVLSNNIGKANAILDRVIEEINRSGMSPRLGEVASQILTTINQSVQQIYSRNIDLGNLQLKNKMVELKEREVKIKEYMSNKIIPNTVNNNLIISDRETVLKLLKENKSQLKMLENENVKENKGEYDANN